MQKKQLITLFKLSVGIALIVLVFSRLDWDKIKTVLPSLNIFYLISAVLFFIVSQILSVFRFDILIRNLGIRLNFKTHSKLYLLGMFYNFFLPGGIGGDAYKVVLLNKSHEKTIKRLGKIIFIDRFLGILAIMLILFLLLPLVRFSVSVFWIIFLSLLGIAVVLFILVQTSKISKIYSGRINRGFIYSLLIQSVQMISLFFIILSLGIKSKHLIYMMLFLVSSVLSVFSFAGLGIRESVFYFGASMLGTDPDISAVAALIFSLITAGVSFFGVVFLWKGINLKQ